MKKGFKIEDVPDEVMRCWQYQSLPFVGSWMAGEINRIVEKYPEWFKWEHKYAAIPEEVHEAFQKELYPEVKMPEFNDENAGKGILERMKDNPPTTTTSITVTGLKEMFSRLDNAAKERQEKEKRRYELWQKHYKKYGLEYRKESWYW